MDDQRTDRTSSGMKAKMLLAVALSLAFLQLWMGNTIAAICFGGAGVFAALASVKK